MTLNQDRQPSAVQVALVPPVQTDLPVAHGAGIMPKEINYLAFSNEELAMALAAFRRSQGQPCPGDTIERLSVRQTNGTFVVIARTQDSQSGKAVAITFGPHDVLAALILFCKRQGIPLAMKAHKGLEVIGDQIAMLTTANFSYSRPEEKNGTIIYTDDDLEVSKASLEDER